MSGSEKHLIQHRTTHPTFSLALQGCSYPARQNPSPDPPEELCSVTPLAQLHWGPTQHPQFASCSPQLRAALPGTHLAGCWCCSGGSPQLPPALTCSGRAQKNREPWHSSRRTSTVPGHGQRDAPNPSPCRASLTHGVLPPWGALSGTQAVPG